MISFGPLLANINVKSMSGFSNSKYCKTEKTGVMPIPPAIKSIFLGNFSIATLWIGREPLNVTF
ncbi:unnamed protein product [Debaryomyces tyrocola]|nr:unnamed protein product [Debaryomyces tyrocola]